MILYGPPGTGKTFLAEHLARVITEQNGLIERVQFHPAYAYEDWMQGIRPHARPDGTLSYEMVPGRFLEFCTRAQEHSGACVLIVDEINRADLGRVFGELMFGLEYRDQPIPLASGGSLRVPANVRLIGTMNTANRAVAPIDPALRRRFAFMPLRPDFDILRFFHARIGASVEGLIRVLERLNARIDDPERALGITYFLVPDLPARLEDIWLLEIEPHLEELFFDRPELSEEFRWARVRREMT